MAKSVQLNLTPEEAEFLQSVGKYAQQELDKSGNNPDRDVIEALLNRLGYYAQAKRMEDKK
jgi:hypothetical protein